MDNHMNSLLEGGFLSGDDIDAHPISEPDKITNSPTKPESYSRQQLIIDKEKLPQHFSGGTPLPYRQRRVGVDTYESYLQTPHWKEKAKQARARAKYQCLKCGKKPDTGELEVHHLSYSHIWDERPEELLVVCESCHKKFHPEY
jgi:hypothetical protein